MQSLILEKGNRYTAESLYKEYFETSKKGGGGSRGAIRVPTMG